MVDAWFAVYKRVFIGAGDQRIPDTTVGATIGRPKGAIAEKIMRLTR